MWKLIGPEINKHSRVSGYQSAARTNLFIRPADDWFLSERHSARYFDPLPVHPSVLIGEKRSNHRPHVIRHASASKSRHNHDALVNLRVVPHHAAAEVGRNLCVQTTSF